MVDSKQRLVAARQKARHYAVQAIYQWQLNEQPWSDIASQFLTDYSLKKQEQEYFTLLLKGVLKNLNELDALLAPHMENRTLEEAGPVELAILRVGAYEFKHCIDVPYKAVINEAVNLGKKFAATDGFKFINGVLDRLAVELRPIETQA